MHSQRKQVYLNVVLNFLEKRMTKKVCFMLAALFPVYFSSSTAGLHLPLFQVHVLPRPPHQHAGGDRPAFKTHTGPQTTTLFLQRPLPPITLPVPLPGPSFKQQPQGRMNSPTHHNHHHHHCPHHCPSLPPQTGTPAVPSWQTQTPSP